MTIYSGTGNTFLMIDNRSEDFSYSQSSPLCTSHKVDGLITVENSDSADFRMRIFNRNGVEAQMCGNGLRCFIKFLEELNIRKAEYQIETVAGLHRCSLIDNEVCVQMLPPHSMEWNLSMEIDGTTYSLHYLNTGVPHIVVFDEEAIDRLGKPIREQFDANVNFVSLLTDQSIQVRTYERGVEAETPACGTGATASALAAAKLHALPSPITVHVRSHDTLKISFKCDGDRFSGVTMQGEAFSIKQKSPILST